MLGAVFYLILVFGCATSASSEKSSDFSNIAQSALSFFQISIGMYPAENFHSLKESRWIMVMCVGFTVLAPWPHVMSAWATRGFSVAGLASCWLLPQGCYFPLQRLDRADHWGILLAV